jgi:hypothetical protein
MHVVHTRSGAAAARVDGVARGRGSAAVVVGAIAIALAGFLGCDRIPVMLMMPNRHLTGVKHSVCSLAQGGLCVVDVRQPGALEPAVASAWSGLIFAHRHGYYDIDALLARLEALKLYRSDLPIIVPSVNVRARMADSRADGPGAAETFPSASTRLVDAPCLGLNFHVVVSQSMLSIELRAGEHLVSQQTCRELVLMSMRSILEG